MKSSYTPKKTSYTPKKRLRRFELALSNGRTLVQMDKKEQLRRLITANNIIQAKRDRELAELFERVRGFQSLPIREQMSYYNVALRVWRERQPGRRAELQW